LYNEHFSSSSIKYWLQYKYVIEIVNTKTCGSLAANHLKWKNYSHQMILNYLERITYLIPSFTPPRWTPSKLFCLF